MPCRQTKALDGLLPMPGAPWDLRQHNRAHAGAASNGQGALLQCPQDGVLERRTKHGEAGVIKSASLGALFYFALWRGSFQRQNGKNRIYLKIRDSLLSVGAGGR